MPTSISLSDRSVRCPLAAPPHPPQMAPFRGCPAQHTPRRLKESARRHELIQQRASLGLWMQKTEWWCFYFQTYNSPFATEQKHKKMQFIEALVLEEKQLPLREAGKHVHNRLMGDHFCREHQADLLHSGGVTIPTWTWDINHVSAPSSITEPEVQTAGHLDTADINTPLHTYRIFISGDFKTTRTKRHTEQNPSKSTRSECQAT